MVGGDRLSEHKVQLLELHSLYLASKRDSPLKKLWG